MRITVGLCVLVLTFVVALCMPTFGQTTANEKSTYGSERETHQNTSIWSGTLNELAENISCANQVTASNANVPKLVEEWEILFNSSEAVVFPSVQQTKDEGYIISGYVSPGLEVIKTNSNGITEWKKTFDQLAQFSKCLQTADGGYILAGGTGRGIWKVALIKIDSNGNKIWEKIYPNDSEWANYVAFSVLQTIDGGYLINGWTDQDDRDGDGLLAKFDSSGSIVWKNWFFSRQTKDQIWLVQPTKYGGYIMTGNTKSFGAGGSDIWLIKYNNSIYWNKTFGGSDYDDGRWVLQTSDGGYIIAGETQSFGSGGMDFLLIMTDSNGNKIWDKTFGGPLDEYIGSICQTADGGYMLLGSTESFGSGKGHAYLIKTDSNGNKICDWAFGDVYSSGQIIQQTSDGGYVLAGETHSQDLNYNTFWILKLKQIGDNGTDIA